ncbi:MAG: GtrA family protein [Xanthobacteraceae bacterium]|uniref:GtrA family protein n=1 Tax=Pseudolabrys sp. TaxID=1960880 RepID=UPI003D12265A
MNIPESTSETHSPVRRVTRALRDRTFIAKAASFGAIGVVNSAVDFAVFTLAFVWLALPIIPANLMSWAVAVTFSYVLNSMFTFAAESGRKLAARTYVSFVVAQVAGFIANTAVVLIASYFIPVLFGKLLAIGASFVVNFSLSHFVVFRRRGGTLGQDAPPPSSPPSSSV